jgi:AraC-like DNA-binding protein
MKLRGRLDREGAVDNREPRSRAALFKLLGQETEAIQARFGKDAFSRHYHDTFSFGLVLEGVNSFAYRRRTFEANAGSIGICDPGEVHDGGRAGIAWAYRSAFPTAETMTAIAADLGMDGMPVFNTGHLNDPASVARLRKFLGLLFARDVADPNALEEAGIDALSTIISNNAVGVTRTHRSVEHHAIAASALEVIHDRWNEPVAIADMADAAGASRFSVIRSVAKATGLTPHSYLIQLRVRRAKELMRQGLPIAWAAADAGFVDQSHLTKSLVQRWGVTPGAFSRAYAGPRQVRTNTTGSGDSTG